MFPYYHIVIQNSHVTINEAIKSKLYAKPVHSVYIAEDQSFVRKDKSLYTMDSSAPTPTTFMLSFLYWRIANACTGNEKYSDMEQATFHF
ncbi:UNVERIFIED_CONTAM: hypothetical protein NCL1_16359 [Trichonephila clavipes]